MRQVTPGRAVLVGLLLAVALFCAYGFLASMEPGPGHLPFRIGYPIVGIACIAGSAVLLFRK